jgi:hypothetical protein
MEEMVPMIDWTTNYGEHLEIHGDKEKDISLGQDFMVSKWNE